MNGIRICRQAAIEMEEYIGFLARSDLGNQYPREQFRDRIERLLENASLRVTARNGEGALVGVAMGLTDFAYFLLITDLGVDRRYEGRGIGRQLVEKLVEEAGGRKEISVVTVANDQAIGFYQSLSFENGPDVLWRPCEEWTPFEVDDTSVP